LDADFRFGKSVLYAADERSSLPGFDISLINVWLPYWANMPLPFLYEPFIYGIWRLTTLLLEYLVRSYSIL
jgi:hypothetical protein